MIKACVIGWPIEHSRSPVIHRYWLDKYQINGSYDRIAVPPDELAGFLGSLAEHGLAGCNVTVPHKEAVLGLADELDVSAVAIGAANTLWLDRGRIMASNTDAYGYMAYLDRRAPQWRERDAPVAILGAGGAARAIIHGFLEAGVERIDVFNRSLDRVAALSRHFGPNVVARAWDERQAAVRGYGVIVNTTTLGMKGNGDPGIDFSSADPQLIVSDIVYVPLQTPFLLNAQAHGLVGVDGLGMLLHQAAPGFARWFGLTPEVTEELYAMVAADIIGEQTC